MGVFFAWLYDFFVDYKTFDTSDIIDTINN